MTTHYIPSSNFYSVAKKLEKSIYKAFYNGKYVELSKPTKVAVKCVKIDLNDICKVGDTIKATIKGHNDFKGVKQTIITRGNVINE